MSTPLKLFQVQMRDALEGHFRALLQQYDALPQESQRHALRQEQAAVMLQAPTGVGKTLIAVEMVREFSAQDRLVWLWFVPFTGLINQAERTFQAQAPGIKLLSVEADRFVESLRPGGVYVLSWQSVASSKARRLLRETRDDGLSLDALITQARSLGYRIGCVVDEAHHGFQRAREAATFFAEVLRPDYALLMSATPRDVDATGFSRRTGYEVGRPEDWATISRAQGVEAGLLKPEVKTVRFIARPGNESKMLDFERVALTQATALHRRIKEELRVMGVGVTPLMLVQVPNGGEAVDTVERLLIEELGFAPGAVRKHTADEPDEHLSAIANDPEVEVLVFKMAVALGFDAPRAFTLAALRGVRDRDFGTQVVGRIMRVHRLLQGRSDVPPLLNSGYVFLANEADQEGLREAATLIDTLRAQEPQLGRQFMITLEVGSDEAQVTFASSDGVVTSADSPLPQDGALEVLLADMDDAARDALLSEAQGLAHEMTRRVHPGLFDAAHEMVQVEGALPQAPGTFAGSQDDGPLPALPSTALAELLARKPSGGRLYRRIAQAPATLRTERLPTLPDNFEEQVVSLVDFTAVLGDRDRTRTQLTQRTEGLFDEDDKPLDESILAQLSVTAIAERARQIALPYNDVDARDFLHRLELRFRQAIERQGIEMPVDAETVRRQLDLVLVRNPRLIREAHRRVRAGLIEVADVSLPEKYLASQQLSRSAKNVYGVFPEDLNREEREFANMVDADPEVRWWHRNPSNGPSSIVLWAWSGGVHAFHPDFILAVEGRPYADGEVLVEVKGQHLQEWEKAKAGATARIHGRVFMVGKRGDDGVFYFLHLENDQLEMDGLYETQRLKVNA